MQVKNRAYWVRTYVFIWAWYLLEAEWRIYASVNYASIGSDNSLSSVRRQAIIWSNARILLIGHVRTIVSGISLEIHTILFAIFFCHLRNGGHFVVASLWNPFTHTSQGHLHDDGKKGLDCILNGRQFIPVHQVSLLRSENDLK